MRETALTRSAMQDFVGAYAASERFEPRQKPVSIAIGTDERSFAFQMEGDLIKLVTLTPRRRGLELRVRYATDTVVQDERHVIELGAQPHLVADAYGLVVRWRAALLPGLAWPSIRKSRRF